MGTTRVKILTFKGLNYSNIGGIYEHEMLEAWKHPERLRYLKRWSNSSGWETLETFK